MFQVPTNSDGFKKAQPLKAGYDKNIPRPRLMKLVTVRKVQWGHSRLNHLPEMVSLIGPQNYAQGADSDDGRIAPKYTAVVASRLSSPPGKVCGHILMAEKIDGSELYLLAEPPPACCTQGCCFTAAGGRVPCGGNPNEHALGAKDAFRRTSVRPAASATQRPLGRVHRRQTLEWPVLVSPRTAIDAVEANGRGMDRRRAFSAIPARYSETSHTSGHLSDGRQSKQKTAGSWQGCVQANGNETFKSFLVSAPVFQRDNFCGKLWRIGSRSIFEGQADTKIVKCNM
ncbi:hypothetical protein O181_001561 [Austropuccinia psidii MF-1]|uniref:Uncharacterized protein n=1 Tax=Austropuccinia psidii MF-1 TaxID=1389203 RepID=A0A9Q3GCI7_9BASI|nr:hypothetical protein [Austropuccinia psidii MF-1]